MGILGNSILIRYNEILDFFGESVTIDSVVCQVMVRVFSSGEYGTWLDDIEAMGFVHPGLYMIAKAGASLAVTDTFVREGKTYEIYKLWMHRVNGVAVYQVAICSE